MSNEKDTSIVQGKTGSASGEHKTKGVVRGYDDQMLFNVLMSDLWALIKNGFAVTTANDGDYLVIRIHRAERIVTEEGKIRLQPSVINASTAPSGVLSATPVVVPLVEPIKPEPPRNDVPGVNTPTLA